MSSNDKQNQSTNSTSNATKSSSSFNAFTYVDSLVSKPVLGSDGAAKWQEWNHNKSNESSSNYVSKHTAPEMPMKRNDRLNTGMSSLKEERLHEDYKRKLGGFQLMGKGYTNFKQKKEILQSKEHMDAMKRIRPDHIPYYYPSNTFDGYRKDYIFTTRKPRGTGYYWDGMDTFKEITAINSTKEEEEVNKEVIQPKKKKKKKSKSSQSNSDNKQTDTTSTDSKWKEAIDEKTNKVYYYNIETNETKWECPIPIEGNEENNINSSISKQEEEWKSTIDSSTGKEYYYNKITKETTWMKPHEL